MKTVYLNWKGLKGRETVDQFRPELGQSMREFRAYVREMVANYRECGIAVYKSSRPCANWKR
ncbi:hypothetical protein TPMD04_65 [Thiohalocapsa phage LS06-2018-MD04]|jgi:hypothetical protein|nr:hypothetical protein TPMD04_65 [Thiohalocapsa phage LS06-2018-MD04]